jgi:phospholipase/lecithinase/hemolysin
MLIRLAAAMLLGLAVATPAATPAAAATPPYPAIYVFGDSLSDAGNDWILTKIAQPTQVEPKSPPYSLGRFSNGAVWAQDLAGRLGLGSLAPSLHGGTDFAYGGAESGPTMVHGVATDDVIDLPSQLAQFALDVKHPKPGALYVLWIGSNDLFDILAATPPLSPANVAKTVNEVVNNELAAVAVLRARGMQRLLVLTAPDLGRVPQVADNGATAAAAGSTLAKQFNTALVAKLKVAAFLGGIDLTVVDAYAEVDTLIAHAAAYGFTDTTTPCWTGTYTGTGGTLCSASVAVQNGHLFWDHVHPTARGHHFIATVAAAALN